MKRSAVILLILAFFIGLSASPPAREDGRPGVATADASVATTVVKFVVKKVAGQWWQDTFGDCAPWAVFCPQVAYAPSSATEAPTAPAMGVVETGGTGLNLRSGPGTGYGITGVLPDGTGVTIVCTTYAETVDGIWGPTALWNRLSSGEWVSDGFIYTGTNGPVAPQC